MLNFDFSKLDNLQATTKRESKYSFLSNNIDDTKKILDTLKRGVQLNKIVNLMNESITDEKQKLNSISFKAILKDIIKNNKAYKSEYKDLFKTRKTKESNESKE